MSTIDVTVLMIKVINCIKELHKCKPYQLIKKYKLKRAITNIMNSIFKCDLAKVLSALVALRDTLKKSTGVTYKSNQIISYPNRYEISVKTSNSTVTLNLMNMDFNIIEEKYSYSVNTKVHINIPFIKSRWEEESKQVREKVKEYLYDLAVI